MRKCQAFKSAIFAASALMFLSITNSNDIVYAEELTGVEIGVAGISKTLNDIYTCGDNEVCEKVTDLFYAEIYSPLANLGVSVASNYVNVRSHPSTDSEVVGKLYNGCAAEILEWLEGDWVKIESGDVEGYIASNYLVTGKDAEKMADEHAKKFATVTTQTLRVREEQSTDSRILEQIPLESRFPVVKEYDEWAEILISSDDEGRDFTGYVHKDFVDIEIIFKEAISIEEEQRIIRQQEEAERAEAERLQRLAEEEERRRNEEARRQEEARRKAEEAKKTEEKKSEEKSSTSSSSGSATGKEIAEYAQNFVGNRYVWGGVSLTKGADCSGFVYTLYQQYGYKLERTSREQAKTAGKKISLSERQPGDLLFYTNNSGIVNHVALYIGNDKIVHAASSKQGIIISPYNYRKVYCIRRVIN